VGRGPPTLVVFVMAQNVHEFAGKVAPTVATRYCRCVLPSTPSPIENSRFTYSEDVIDLRSSNTGSEAGNSSHWELAVGTPSALGVEPAAAALGSATALLSQPEANEEFSAASSSTLASVKSASVSALVLMARDGDPRAWEELVVRFGGMIAATGRRYRLTPSDVAELQQTTWLRLVENLHRIEQPERVGGWLATTARRESLHLVRRAGKYHAGADQMLANLPDRHLPEPDARPIAEEREVLVKAAWGRLKPRCQELLSLLISDDPVGYKDLSKLLQMPIGSIGPTRQRCLAHLRRLVEEEGL
jgi:RNA polymerase sigma factor (sigma-70 family)